VAVDWEGERKARGKELTAIEEKLFASFGALVGNTLDKIEPKVMSGGKPDPRGAFAAQGWFTGEVGDWVEENLRPSTT
jgi:hypothetical protein